MEASAHKVAKKLLNLKSDNLEKEIIECGFDFFGERYRMDLTMNILNKLKIIDLSVLILSFVSCIIGVIALEKNMTFEMFQSFDSNNTSDKHTAKISFDPKSPPVANLRMTNSILTLLIIIGITLHYIIRFKYDKFRSVVPKNMSLFNINYSFYMFLEIFLNLIHTPINVDSEILLPQRSAESVHVNIDVILTIFMLFFRSYHVIKYFAFHSKWNNIYNEKICEASNVKFNFSFCIKAEFKQNPFYLVSIVLIISIFIFGYSLRCAEMFFMYYTSAEGFNTNWKDIWNGLWCVIITMTTVGFGDYYPISFLGRIIVVIACFWGTFLISLMVAALTYIVEFNSQEAVAYEKIKASNNERDYGLKAVILLQSTSRYLFHMKKLNNDVMLINDPKFRALKSNLFGKMKIAFENFRKIKNIKEKQSFYLEMEKVMKKLNVNISNEMDKIKEEINIMPEIKKLLYDYHKNQENLKIKILELYKELEEITIFKDYYVKI